jgi:iron complex outermembrane receptor protein
MVQVWKGKSFIATASFQLRGQTGRAKDVTGNLFNRYNAEERARIAGININSFMRKYVKHYPGFTMVC